MSSTKKIFDSLLTRIKGTLTNKSVKPDEVIETKQYTPERYIDIFLKKEQVLMKKFAETRVKDTISLFITAADPYITKKEIPFNEAFECAIYFTFAANCINARQLTATEEVVDEALGRKVISQALQVLSDNHGKYTGFLVNHYSIFLSAIGSHSEHIYDYMFNKLQSEFMSQSSTTASLEAILRPWIYMPSSVERVSNCLKPIASNLTLVTEKFRLPFCNMLVSTVLRSLRNDVFVFADFLNKQADIMIAQNIHEQINNWNEKNNCFAWPAQMLMQVLLPSKMNTPENQSPTSLYGKCLDFQSLRGNLQSQAIQTIFTGFATLVLSNNQPILSRFFSKIFPPFYEWYIKNKPTYPDSDMMKRAYVEFPLAVLMITPLRFQSEVVPYLMKEDTPKNWVYMAKIIKRFCRQNAAFPNRQTTLYEYLFTPCIQLFERCLNDERAMPCLLPLLQGFQIFPPFMRALLLSQPDFLEKIYFPIVRKHQDIGFQYSFIGYFDAKTIEDAELDEQRWAILKIMMSFFAETYQNITLRQYTQFGEAVPIILQRVTEFLSAYFTLSDTDLEDDVANGFPVLYMLEGHAIMFLAASNDNTISIGFNILSAIIDIYHSSPNFEQLSMPIEIYQSLVQEYHKTNNVSTAKNEIARIIRQIPSSDHGLDLAFKCLHPYFQSVTKTLSPNIMIASNEPPLTRFAENELSSIFAGLCRILFAIVFDQALILFTDLKALLSDTGIVGRLASSLIPSSVNTNQYMTVTGLILNYIGQQRTPDGIFDTQSSLGCLVKNSMHVILVLAKQRESWNAQMINPKRFGQLIRQFTMFADMTQGQSFKLPCAECINAIMNIMLENDVNLDPHERHQIGRQLLSWIPTDEGNKEYVSTILKALSSLLDGLALLECVDSNDPRSPEEQAVSNFKFYFAAIKSRIELQESSAIEMVPMLSALLKENLMIGIEHCISMGLTESSGVRAAFIASVASVFKVPEAKAANVEEVIEESTNLIDILFPGDFELVDLVGTLVPPSRSDVVGGAFVEAAVSKNTEFEYLAKAIDRECAKPDANPATLFRGNGVPERAVGHYPRLVGTEWMTKTLRPIFDDVIARVDAGESFVVDPAKLEPGDDIEANRVRFRELLMRFINTINEARPSMPPRLVKEAQLLYGKVYEIHGEFALQILSGFLFLRFLLPAFTVTKMVGLPPLLPDKPRAVLTQCSAILMAATLKGKLDDKGPHIALFNDVAQYAYDTFGQMFRDITTMDIGPINPEDLTVNPEQINSTIHQELFGLIPNIEKLFATYPEDAPVKQQADALIAKLQAMGAPKGSSNRKGARPAAGQSNVYEELMNRSFPDDLVEQLSDFVTKLDYETPDGHQIVYVNISRLSIVRDPMIAFYLFFKVLSDERLNQVYIVCDLFGFSETNVPPPQTFIDFKEAPPISKINRWIFLTTPPEFATFAKQISQLFEKEQRFFFPKKLSELTDLIGQVPKTINPIALEALTNPESVQPATVNNIDLSVRLHQSTMQLLYKPVAVGKYQISGITVYNFADMAGFTKPHPTSNPEFAEFTVSFVSKAQIRFKVPAKSSLYESTYSLSCRAKQIGNMDKKMNIDISTIQWLMLNFSFANMCNVDINALVHKASLDLCYAILQAFDMKHEIQIDRCELDLLPFKLLDYAVQISSDVAQNNADAYWGFIQEFMRVFSYLESRTKALSLYYLQPWLQYWSKDVSTHPEVSSFLVKAFTEIPMDTDAFSDAVIPIITKSKAALHAIIQESAKNGNIYLIELIQGLAFDNSTDVTNYLVNTLLPEVIASKGNASYLVDAISMLLVSHIFDQQCLPQAIYHISRLRLYEKEETLVHFQGAIANLMHSLCRLSGRGMDESINTKEVCLGYSSTKLRKEFASNEEGQKRYWSAQTRNIAHAIASCMDDKNLRDQTYQLFTQQMKSDDVLEKSNATIWAAAFAGKENAKKFASDQSRLLSEDSENSTVIATFCEACSLLDVDSTTASKLMFIALCLAFYKENATAADLVVASIRQAGQSSSQILSSIQDEKIQYIETCTAIPFSTRVFYGTLLVMGAFGDDPVSMAKEVIKSGVTDDFVDLIHCLVDNTTFEKVKKANFGEDIAAVEACLLLFFKKEPLNQPLTQILEYFIKHETNGFASVNVGGEDFIKELVTLVEDPRVISLLMSVQKMSGGEFPMPAMLYPYFLPSSPKVELSIEQVQYLIADIF